MNRQVTTVEELDALWGGAVFHDAVGDVFEGDGCGNYEKAGSTYPYESYEIYLPATVLWEPAK